ncbi:LD-carboxypeptidase [Synechococcus sp. PCC 7336]|uniref:S66 peptidase family protein n=1 Tax=Synechococcus sp. PCC 7336 TaxID=195250 RepID=UPI0003729B93|nr:LD-carboxypeptidase [Synechococcus sp. PCC 7336]
MSGLAGLQFPARLQEGDRICVVLPSGGVTLADLEPGLQYWRQWGYEVVSLVPQESSELEYLAGTDGARLNSLQTALDDPHCRAIVCGRGGYGATRLLPHLDWTQFCQSPKWIVGFSDITALLWAAARRGVASVHGPIVKHMPLESDVSRDRLHGWLTQGYVDSLQGLVWSGGTATGLLMPANLTVATALLGTRDWPLADRPAILAIEDINEEAYRLDRLLTQWRNAGAFEGVAGIALGRFSWSDDWHEPVPYSAEAALRDRLLDLGIPIVAQLKFGHGEGDNLALPVGAIARLDGDRGSLSLLEATPPIS